MSGLDVVAGAAGLFGLSVTLFQGCVRGFVLLSTAQNFGNAADVARCKIALEQNRLLAWAERVDIEGTPKRNLNWRDIEELLRQLSALLNDVKKIEDRYGLVLEAAGDTLDIEDLKETKSGLGARLTRLRPKFFNETAQRLHKDNGPLRRLRWAAIDENGIRIMVQDIVYFNDRLESLLEIADRDSITASFEILKRSLVVQSTSIGELEDVKSLLNQSQNRRPSALDKAVTAAATLKQRRIELEFDVASQGKLSSASSRSSTLVARQSPASSSRASLASKTSTPKSISLKADELTDYASSSDIKRELGRYEGQRVIIEWKTVERGLDSKLKHRIKALATLLSSTAEPSFHSLSCRGFLKESKTGRYAYIFSIPAAPQSQVTPNATKPPEFRSLLQLLQLEGMRPELSERISIGLALAETVLQLHTSGWLHKGIRSENVLLFDQGGHDWTLPTQLKPVFLGGYEFARADNPLDMTETPAAQQEADIYRHPLLVGPAPASFCKEFDLYALGCLLVELALWRPLQTVLIYAKKGSINQEGSVASTLELGLRDRNIASGVNSTKSSILTDGGRGSVLEEMEFFAGKKFAEAASICLKAADVSASKTAPQSENDETGEVDVLDTQQRVISLLRSCQV